MSRNPMSLKFSLIVCGVVVAMAMCVPVAATAQTCGPLNNGRVADVVYKGNAIFFDPVVRYEYKRATLTISGPCEDIVRSFDPGEQIFFDLGEITRVLDGTYKWELRFEPAIDPEVREMLDSSRGTGEEDAVWWSLWQKGAIPPGPSVDGQGFTVVGGEIIDPGTGEESQKSAVVATKAGAASPLIATVAEFEDSGSAVSSTKGEASLAPKGAVLTNSDGIIRNSLCVGFDCPNSPTFSDTTILLMENNDRIKFDDTSTINSFPRNDWEIEANSNLNGGASYLGFNDCGQSSQGGCASDLVFAVEAGARQNALYVESDGDVGFGTANPVVRLHTTDGDTPALRLEQDGSSGFAPQTWDIAGNETSFFIRDATNGSTLPFRIRPGASSNSLVIDSDDDVGIGVLSADAPLHVLRSGSIGSDGQVHIENNSGTASDRNMLRIENNGPPTLLFSNTNAASNGSWTYTVTNGGIFQINASGSGTPIELQLSEGGDMTIGGMLTELSSREAKTGFENLDGQDVLERLANLPVTVWNYKHDDDGIRHIGPMAEDFYAAFNVGTDAHHIAPSDKAGVALAAIQGLNQVVREKDAEIEALRMRLEKLEEALVLLTEEH